MQMAAFPYQDHVPSALDFGHLPSFSPFHLPPPSAQQQAGGVASASSCLPCYYDPVFDAIDDVFLAEFSAFNAGTSSVSAVTAITPTPESSNSLESGMTVPSVKNKITPSSAQRSEAAPEGRCFLQKKRRDRQRRNSDSAQSKDSEAGRSRKQKKSNGDMEKTEGNKAPQISPTGYIHVRARRGEATDNHSLAERVRREKIRERMKMLQDLVPGCDKVVGKALLLEEIINYVRSLQNQVEFLSMKLASMDPTPYGFDLFLDDYMIQAEGPENMSLGLPNVQRTSHIQPTDFADAANIHPVQHSSVPFLQHGEGSGAFSQDNGSNCVMQVGNRRQGLLNEAKFDNMPFQ